MNTSSEVWDAIVVGAGPSGSSSALMLARSGFRVLLVDAKRFPRRKVCGGCLNSVSMRLVQQLLAPSSELWRESVPLDSFQLMHRQKKFRFAMPDGIAVDREKLDQALVDVACESGVAFQPLTSAKLGDVQGAGRLVHLSGENGARTVRATVVIMACGLGNRAAGSDNESLQQTARRGSRVGIEAIFQNYSQDYHGGAIHMVVGRQGYVGLTQIGGGRLHVAAAVDRGAVQKSGPEQLVSSILQEAGAAQMLLDRAVTWRGTPPLTAKANRLAAERVFLVGDAAGYVEPFTGEGVRWALEGGLAVVDFAAAAVKNWQPQLASAWQKWHCRNIGRQQRLCRRISQCLKQPAATWFAHQALRLEPRLATLIIARLNHQESTT